MKKFLNLFKSHTDIYFTLQHDFDPVVQPKSLIDQLTSANSAHLSEFLKKAQRLSKKSALYRMRILTILALLFLHSDKFYEVAMLIMPFNIKNHDENGKQDQNKWLDQHFIKPFQQYLMKCCSSSEMYQNIKTLSKLRIFQQQKFYNFESLYYIINLLKKLGQSIEKISALGRYYQKDNQNLTKNFIFIICLHMIKLYGTAKIILSEMLVKPKKYLETPSQKGLMKNILLQQLSQVNQCLKQSVLNKYFNPYGSGIRIGLFTCQNQPNDVNNTIQAIVKDESIISTDRRAYIQSVQQMKDQYSISKQSLFSQTSIQSFNRKIAPNQVPLASVSNNISKSNTQQTQNWVCGLSNSSQGFKKKRVTEQSTMRKHQKRGKSRSMKQIRSQKKVNYQHMKTLEQMGQQDETDQSQNQRNLKQLQQYIPQSSQLRKKGCFQTINQNQNKYLKGKLQKAAQQNLSNPTNTPCQMVQ